MIDWRRAAYRYPGTPVLPWITRGFGTIVTPIISEIVLAGSFILDTLLSGKYAPNTSLSGNFDDKDTLEGST